MALCNHSDRENILELSCLSGRKFWNCPSSPLRGSIQEPLRSQKREQEGAEHIVTYNSRLVYKGE